MATKLELCKEVITAEYETLDPENTTEIEDGWYSCGNNEYCVWTAEEAAAHGYLAGGSDTSDSLLKVYRIK